MNRDLGADLLGRLPALSIDELNDLLGNVSARKGEVQSWLFEKAVCELAKRDPWAALSWFEAEEGRTFSVEGLEIVSELAAANDCGKLLVWYKNVQKTVPKEFAQVLAGDIFASLASYHPALALDSLEEILEPQASHRATNSVFAILARKDLESTMQLALGSYRGSQLDSILLSMAGSVGGDNPSLGLEVAADIKDIQTRSLIVSSLIGQLAQVDPSQAVGHLELLGMRDLQLVLGGKSGPQGSSIIELLASEDPNGILRIVNKLPLTSQSIEIHTSAISSVAGVDYARAYDLIASFPAGKSKDQLIDRYAQLTDSSGLSVLIEIAVDKGDKRLLESSVRTLAQNCGVLGVEEVSRVVASVPEHLRTEFQNEALISACHRDPEAVVRYMNDQSYNPGSQKAADQLYSNLGAQLQNSSHEFVEPWLASLPEEHKVSAFKGVAIAMVKSDIVALSEKLAEMPSSRARDEGIKVLLEELRRSDPEMAKAWENQLKQQ